MPRDNNMMRQENVVAPALRRMIREHSIGGDAVQSAVVDLGTEIAKKLAEAYRREDTPTG